jgi:hypothetical protein
MSNHVRSDGAVPTGAAGSARVPAPTHQTVANARFGRGHQSGAGSVGRSRTARTPCPLSCATVLWLIGPNPQVAREMTAAADQEARRMHLVLEATRVLGSEEKARRWLTEWSPFLAGIPNDMAASSEGFQLVMDELLRIDFGDLT